METAKRIGAVIPEVLRQTRRQHGPLFAIQRRWARLVGKSLAKHTKPVSLRRGRLVVHVDRPGDSFTLSYQRARLIARLQGVTQGHLEEIVLRHGEL